MPAMVWIAALGALALIVGRSSDQAAGAVGRGAELVRALALLGLVWLVLRSRPAG